MMLFSELMDEFAKGERSLADLITEHSGEMRTALMRCAAARCFDRELAKSVLLAGTADTFEQLVNHPEVESVPRESGVYRLRSSARSANWRAWWADAPDTEPHQLPPALENVLRKLVDYYSTRDRPVDLLAHTALVSPLDALQQFESLYSEADKAFDLPKCQDLIDVLSDPERIPLLSPALNNLRVRDQAYLRARGLWSAEWFGTTGYLELSGTSSVYQDLLNPGGPRALNLHAPGGRGKSMQLRWLISRRLVPEAALGGLAGGRVPCAKVDFDFIDPINATRYPWIVLLELAAQLNDQLPSPPFSQLLEAQGWALPLLRRNPADSGRVTAASQRVQTQGQRIGLEVVRKFGQILAEHVGGGPVVFVFDTLEEIHLRPQGDLRALLQLVSELLDMVSGLRLVLAGRYPIQEILDSVADALPPIVELAVEPFTASEADRYIRDFRLIKSPETRQAVVDKANGDPFLLSLLADVVQERPHLPVAEIKSYPADVIYLISRVIKRIQEPGVRWLLRYGVVPRRLTLAFVTDVMRPYLRDAMSGRLANDEPALDELPQALVGERENFPTNLIQDNESVLNLADLWADLRRYAGSTSWVSEVPGSPDTLRFRVEVVSPMRAIVRKQAVYRQLHEQAVSYFEAKAEAEPARWETWTREAIYHRFQLGGPEAVAYWHDALDAAGEAAPARREAIAAELLEPDYVDEHGAPLPGFGDRPIVDTETLVEAQFQRCLALVGLARQRDLAPDDPLWSQAEKGLSVAQQAEHALGRQVLNPAAMAYILGAFALKSGRPEEAEAIVDNALTDAKKTVHTVRLALLLGDIQFARGSRDAAATYRYALSLTQSAGWLAPIWRRILIAEAETDSLNDAHQAYQQAIKVAESGHERAELHIYGADIELRCGFATMAEATARRAVAEAGTTGRRLDVLAAMRVYDVQRAQNIARQADSLMTATVPTGGTSAEAADAREAAGLVASLLMEHSGASTSLSFARSQWQRMGNLDAVARCSLISAAFEMREIGDLNVAAQHLTEAEAIEVTAGGDVWLDCRLLRAELLWRKAQSTAAASLITGTIKSLRAAAAPARRMIRTSVAALAYGDPGGYPEVLDLLIDQCAMVTPVSARLVQLSELTQVRELPAACALRLQTLSELVTMPPDSELVPVDDAVLQMTLAEVRRLAQAPSEAQALLDQARRTLESDSASPFWVRPWSQAVDRLRSPFQPQRLRLEEQFRQSLSAHPLLCAAFLVERAEARISQEQSGAAEFLHEAAQRLAEIPNKKSQWGVRLQQAQAMLSDEEESSSLVMTAGADAFELGLVLAGPTRSVRTGTDPTGERGSRRARIVLTRDAAGVVAMSATIPGSPSRTNGETFELAEIFANGRRDTDVMSRWWMDRQRTGDRTLRSLLQPIIEAAKSGDCPLELQVETKDLVLQALPWELRALGELGEDATIAGVVRVLDAEQAEREETTFIQAALGRLLRTRVQVDADFGPNLRRSVQEYQRLQGLTADGVVRDDVLNCLQHDLFESTTPARPPLVVLVQPNAARQIWSMRGKASEGVDTERTYEYAGFRVLRLESPDLWELRRVVEQAVADNDAPCVLHFAGGLRELGGGLALTFLGGEWAQEAHSGRYTSDEFSVTSVDLVLDAFPRETAHPVVVLDVDSPYSPVESTAQLFMRNAFAADLFSLGHSAAIIATGLAGHSTRRLSDELIRSLGAGSSVFETVARLQNIRSQAFGSESGSGAALFSHLPWLRPVPR